VESVLQNKLVNDYVSDLKAKAKIDVSAASAEPVAPEQPAAATDPPQASEK
jgi:hypothetical protein